MTTLSANINSIGGLNPLTDQTARTVTAAIGTDDASVDASTSMLSGAIGGGLFTDKTNGLSEDDFLRLLMVQLQNQDPSDPMDNADLMAQMAQLEAIQSNNNMEKAIKEMNSSFQGSVSAQQSSAQSMTNATSVSLIGKTVRIQQDEITYSGLADDTTTLRINLGNNKYADVEILDEDGNVVKTLRAADKDASGAAMVTWDGKNEEGTYVTAGTYFITVVGQDSDSSLYAFQEDMVEGVSFSSVGAKLKIAGGEYSVSKVMDVAKEAESSTLGSLSRLSAIELLGKAIRMKVDEITYKARDGEEHEIKVNAEKNSKVTVSILNADGDVVAMLTGESDGKGIATLSWNGQSSNGRFVDAGTYTLKVDGSDINSSLYCFYEGTVDGVSMLGGVPRIRIDGKEISINDIVDISMKA